MDSWDPESDHRKLESVHAGRYRFDPEHSPCTVQAFTAGLLSFLGHSPTFAARSFAGAVEFEDDSMAEMRLELTVEAGSLAATADVPAPARSEMEERMRAEVLGTTRFPEIAFRRLRVPPSGSRQAATGWNSTGRFLCTAPHDRTASQES